MREEVFVELFLGLAPALVSGHAAVVQVSGYHLSVDGFPETHEPFVVFFGEGEDFVYRFFPQEPESTDEVFHDNSS